MILRQDDYLVRFQDAFSIATWTVKFSVQKPAKILSVIGNYR
jgi:hypothetical protein